MGKERNQFEWEVRENDDDWQPAATPNVEKPPRRWPAYLMMAVVVTVFLGTLVGQAGWDTRPQAISTATNKPFSPTANQVDVTTRLQSGKAATGDSISSDSGAATDPPASGKLLLQAALEDHEQGEPISIMEVTYPQADEPQEYIAVVRVIVWPEGGSAWYSETRFYERTDQGWQRIRSKVEAHLIPLRD